MLFYKLKAQYKLGVQRKYSTDGETFWFIIDRSFKAGEILLVPPNFIFNSFLFFYFLYFDVFACKRLPTFAIDTEGQW